MPEPKGSGVFPLFLAHTAIVRSDRCSISSPDFPVPVFADDCGRIVPPCRCLRSRRKARVYVGLAKNGWGGIVMVLMGHSVSHQPIHGKSALACCALCPRFEVLMLAARKYRAMGVYQSPLVLPGLISTFIEDVNATVWPQPTLS